MKLLTFLARRFAWRAHTRTLEDVLESSADEAVEDALVAFLHAEVGDGEEHQRTRVVKHLTKHIKWLAGKRDLKRVVLHSFTHLGAQNAEPDVAQALMNEVEERLARVGYEVHQTPFGHFSEWELSVYGESLAKVWKEI